MQMNGGKTAQRQFIAPYFLRTVYRRCLFAQNYSEATKVELLSFSTVKQYAALTSNAIQDRTVSILRVDPHPTAIQQLGQSRFPSHSAPRSLTALHCVEASSLVSVVTSLSMCGSINMQTV